MHHEDTLRPPRDLFTMKTVVLFALCALVPAAVFAQGQPPGGGAPLEQPGVSPAEIQRMFDAYALLQAQEQALPGWHFSPPRCRPPPGTRSP